MTKEKQAYLDASRKFIEHREMGRQLTERQDSQRELIGKLALDIEAAEKKLEEARVSVHLGRISAQDLALIESEIESMQKESAKAQQDISYLKQATLSHGQEQYSIRAERKRTLIAFVSSMTSPLTEKLAGDNKKLRKQLIELYAIHLVECDPSMGAGDSVFYDWDDFLSSVFAEPDQPELDSAAKKVREELAL